MMMTEKVSIHRTSKLLRKIEDLGACFAEERYPEGLVLVRELLQDAALSSQQRAYLEYQLAVLVDLSGEPSESLTMLLQLRAQRPADPHIAHSVMIVFGHIETEAKAVFAKSPDSPALLGYHRLLHGTSHSPWWLTYAVAKQHAKAGNLDEVDRFLKGLLELSPHDVDYLRAALDVASHLESSTWLNRLVLHIRTLIEKKPYLLSLVTLLPEDV